MKKGSDSENPAASPDKIIDSGFQFFELIFRCETGQYHFFVRGVYFIPCACRRRSGIVLFTFLKRGAILKRFQFRLFQSKIKLSECPPDFLQFTGWDKRIFRNGDMGFPQGKTL